MTQAECDRRVAELETYARKLVHPLGSMSHQEVVELERKLLKIKKQISACKSARTRYLKANPG